MCEHAENREICVKKAKSGETLAKARFDIDGQIVRLRRSGLEDSGRCSSRPILKL